MSAPNRIKPQIELSVRQKEEKYHSNVCAVVCVAGCCSIKSFLGKRNLLEILLAIKVLYQYRLVNLLGVFCSRALREQEPSIEALIWRGSFAKEPSFYGALLHLYRCLYCHQRLSKLLELPAKSACLWWRFFAQQKLSINRALVLWGCFTNEPYFCGAVWQTRKKEIKSPFQRQCRGRALFQDSSSVLDFFMGSFQRELHLKADEDVRSKNSIYEPKINALLRYGVSSCSRHPKVL